MFERDELLDDSDASAGAWALDDSTKAAESAAAGATVTRGDTVFEVDELESTDEEEEESELEEDEEEEWEPTSDEPGGDAYKMFLRSVLGEGETPEENRMPAISALLDDDDDFDFDYLRESALVDDDPFEYRDDRGVHVSRREVVQLCNGLDNSLRPRTRRAAPVARIVVPPRSAPVGATAPVVDHASLSLLRDQLRMHVHLLAAVHADAALLSRTEQAQRALPQRNIDDAKRALQTTTSLATSLIAMRDASVNFWSLIAPYRDAHERAKRASTPFCGLVQAAPFASAFDSPALCSLSQFVQCCAQADATRDTPLSLVNRYPTLLHPQIASKLAPRPLRRSAKSERAPPWAPSDDNLLALTLRKHSRQFGAASLDLLPHRTTADCDNRVRYLSSRRCADNAVKRFVLANSSALSKHELTVVQDALARLPIEKHSDADTWKSIQRLHLPAREWSYLQKMWQLRESRRKYKANYRRKNRAARHAASADKQSPPNVAPASLPLTDASARPVSLAATPLTRPPIAPRQAPPHSLMLLPVAQPSSSARAVPQGGPSHSPSS